MAKKINPVYIEIGARQFIFDILITQELEYQFEKEEQLETHLKNIGKYDKRWRELYQFVTDSKERVKNYYALREAVVETIKNARA